MAEPKRTLRDELQGFLDESPWEWLVPHLKRDAVILVAQELDLLDVAEKVTRDEKHQISEWIGKGLLTKPTLEQIAEWDRLKETKFLTVIVQPYVLAQEHLLH